jgi:hypothetical protein
LPDTAHPIFAPFERLLGLARSLEALNRAAEDARITTETGRPVRFVPPSPASPAYEIRVFETGCVATRPDNLHDWFNALVWLAFPRTKARLNALHAAEIPREGGRRGRLRDMLTIFDEGGALVVSDDAELIGLVRDMRWRELFWQSREKLRRAMRFVVLGHAVLEQALDPRPGITCKAIFVSPARALDEQAAAWLARCGPQATPKHLAPLPVFGYPGWLAASADAGFYDDERYFRPKAGTPLPNQGNAG